MIAIYVETEIRTNLITPFIVTGCFIKDNFNLNKIIDKWKDKQLSYKDCIKIQQQLNKYRDDYYISKCEINNEDITKYSLDVAVKKAVGLIQFRMRSYLLLNNLEDKLLTLVTYSNPYIRFEEIDSYSVPLNLEIPELFISYVYSRATRQCYLTMFNKEYPDLKILKNRGAASKVDLITLLSYKLLPYFYNRDLTFRTFIKYYSGDIESPDWINYYLENQINERLIDKRFINKHNI